MTIELFALLLIFLGSIFVWAHWKGKEDLEELKLDPKLFNNHKHKGQRL